MLSFTTGNHRWTGHCRFFVRTNVGTYVVPFPCRWNSGDWKNAETGDRIEAMVIGWRGLNGTPRKRGHGPQGAGVVRDHGTA
jgi:hypothetical protein